MIKSFRGQIADNTRERIRLSTRNGLMGYKINKFQVVHKSEADDLSATVSIFSEDPITELVTSISALINFDNPLLLGVVAYRSNKTDTGLTDTTIVFDNVKFNQDIFISYRDNETADKTINYYIELEQIPLNLNEATVATLKDMRGRE